jgi:hypothetical protein
MPERRSGAGGTPCSVRYLRIPPVEKDGEVVQHPPEFWEAERAICPERTRAWAWIWTNLDACLKRRPRLERIDVLPGWKKVWNLPRTDIATCLASCGVTGREPEDGGWCASRTMGPTLPSRDAVDQVERVEGSQDGSPHQYVNIGKAVPPHS